MEGHTTSSVIIFYMPLDRISISIYMKLSVIECVFSPEMHASDLGTNHVFEGFYSK